MTVDSRQMTGAIVAGGASARFGGAPKGLLTVGGRRILDRVVNAMRGLTDRVVLVSNADDAGQWVAGVPVIRDVRRERGSLVGIHTALMHARSPVMVVAWDMPFVSSALLTLIAARGADEPYATLPDGPRGLEPFCALYTPACLPVVEAALDADDLRMSNVLRRFPSITRVTSEELASMGDPARFFFNVNTPSDLETAERLESTAGSPRR